MRNLSREPLIRRWPWAAVPLLAWTTFPTFNLSPSNGFDPSWRSGLNIAVDQGVDWASTTYSYGPFGFLTDALVYYALLAGVTLIFLGAMQLVLAGTLLWKTRRVFHPVVAVLASYLILRLPHLASDWILLFGFVWVIAVLEQPAAFADRRWLGPLLGVASAFLLLTKFSVGVQLTALAAVGAWWLPPRRWRSEVVLAASFFAALGVFWVVTGNAIQGLPRWVYGGFQVSAGYSGGVPSEEAGRHWEYTAALLLLAALTCLLWLHTRGVPRERRVALFLAAFLLVFGFWKEGFVRHDGGHVRPFWGACAVAFAAFAWSSRLRWAAGAGLVVTAVIAGYSQNHSNAIYFLNPDDQVHAIDDSTRTSIRDARTIAVRGRRLRLQSESARIMRDQLAVSPILLRELAGRSVLVDPSDITAVWAYGLRFRPLPTFQTHPAYTTYLDGRNARLLASRNAPERVLRRLAPLRLDNILAQFDSPAYFLALFCNYAEVGADAEWEVLAHVPSRCGVPRKIASAEARAGAAISVPEATAPNELVFARIRLPRSFGLRELLLKPARIPGITVDGAGPYRLLAATASAPHVMRIPPVSGFATAFQGGLATNTFAIDGVSSRFRVDFYAVDLRPAFALERIDGRERIVPLVGAPVGLRARQVRGSLERITRLAGDLRLSGWAADVRDRLPATRILAFSGWHLVYCGEPSVVRNDVASRLRRPALASSGFDIRIPLRSVGKSPVRVFAIAGGQAAELPPRGARSSRPLRLIGLRNGAVGANAGNRPGRRGTRAGRAAAVGR